MTLKEKLETIKGKKIAIWCEDEEEANRLVKEYEGDSFTYSYWGTYKNKTCYDLEDEKSYFTHADTDWYLENGFDLVTYKKFIEDISKDKVVITNQNITDHKNKTGKYEKILKLAAMHHDCGKPFCKSFYNTKREITEQAHYYNHENVGAYMILEVLRVYRLSDIERLQISVLINYRMRPYFAWDSVKAYNRDLQILGQEMVDNVRLIHDADLWAH